MHLRVTDRRQIFGEQGRRTVTRNAFVQLEEELRSKCEASQTVNDRQEEKVR